MSEKELAAVLQHHFGDGLVYLPRHNRPRGALKNARRRGFIDAEGYLTRKGRALLARHSFN